MVLTARKIVGGYLSCRAPRAVRSRLISCPNTTPSTFFWCLVVSGVVQAHDGRMSGALAWRRFLGFSIAPAIREPCVFERLRASSPHIGERGIHISAPNWRIKYYVDSQRKIDDEYGRFRKLVARSCLLESQLQWSTKWIKTQVLVGVVILETEMPLLEILKGIGWE